MTDEPMRPIALPLIAKCPAAMLEGAFGDSNNPTLQVQLDTLSGQVYLVPLSVAAARGLLVVLSNWQPLRDYQSEPESPEPPKLQ
jgi:hypothetical protein